MAKSLAIDSSVIVKWFKKGEPFEEEALKLRQDVLLAKVNAFTSELIGLEVCRALVKVGYSSDKIKEVYATLNEMDELGFLRSVSTAVLKNKALNLLVKLNLYVADALNLAVAIFNSSDLLTEDKHLLRSRVKEFMKKKGLNVVRLREAYH
ncbi:TPA: PIN domain-containing protein [Candidatus Bathyarchaeota archaeon]|nr:PIN domain-containing protein [Candidatus Bathyarchaeota archaeon]